MRRVAIVVAIAAVSAALTWVFGWWSVPVVALLSGWLLRRVRWAASLTGLGAALGWAVLLGIDALSGRVGALAARIGGIFTIGSVGIVALTLLFAFALAWSAAALAGTVPGATPRAGDARAPAAAAPEPARPVVTARRQVQ